MALKRRINSDAKGKKGEREWAAILTKEGHRARRTAQVRGSVDSFDVEVHDKDDPFPIKRWEVKRYADTARLNITKLLRQCDEEAEGEAFGLAFRSDGRGEEWWVAMSAEDFFDALYEAYKEGRLAEFRFQRGSK